MPAGCNGGANQNRLFSKVPVGWAFAFGSEGYRWNDRCEHYHYKSETDAIVAAVWALHKQRNSP